MANTQHINYGWRSGRCLIGCLFFLGILAGLPSLSAQVNVSAALTASEAGVGQPVQLQIRVDGSMSAQVPGRVDAEGLEIQYVQRSNQVQVQNFKLTASGVYIYRVIGLHEGEFTIPPIKVDVNGKEYRTDPLKLVISDAASAPGALQGQIQGGQMPQGSAPAPKKSRVAFAELLGVKKTAYVGEVIPVEIRFYFDRRIGVQVQGPPDFGGEGFTARKLGEYNKAFQEVDGVPYEIWRFQTSIVPVKAGKLEIAPASLMIHAQTGAGGMPDMDDLFQRFLGGGGLPPGFGGSEEILVKSNAAEIDVKSLPKEGRPDTFAGAIGEFSMTATADPLKVNSGDPVTLKVTVSGRGNFDAMGAPALTDQDGWRAYPPKEDFQAADAIGYEGKKTFESLLIAQKTLDHTPGVEFAYFDPNEAGYKTLTVEPIPVAAEGSVAAAPTPTPAANVASASPPPAADRPLATPGAADISPMRVVHWDASFAPAWDNRGFFAIQCVGGLAFLAWLAVGMVRRIRQSEGSRRVVEAREMRKLLTRLGSMEGDAGEFYGGAADWLRRLANKGAAADDVDHLTLEDVLTSRSLDEETAEDVRRIFHRYEESRYGGGWADRPTTVDEREKTLATLRAYAAAGGKAS